MLLTEPGEKAIAPRSSRARSAHSSFLIQAQASKAKVVVMANGGADLTNAIKQAKEFGLDRSGQRVRPS